jgi:hypothetical protein
MCTPHHPSPKGPSAQSRPGLDRLGFTQALGGLVFGGTIELQQQWGIAFIAASVAIFFS